MPRILGPQQPTQSSTPFILTHQLRPTRSPNALRGCYACAKPSSRLPHEEQLHYVFGACAGSDASGNAPDHFYFPHVLLPHPIPPCPALRRPRSRVSQPDLLCWVGVPSAPGLPTACSIRVRALRPSAPGRQASMKISEPSAPRIPPEHLEERRVLDAAAPPPEGTRLERDTPFGVTGFSFRAVTWDVAHPPFKFPTTGRIASPSERQTEAE